ncbi:hypothetical protein CK203_043506 [Vitis vinifera]|uniref:Uncharacterized protein n=1 Tax=Vitis vinifera TaxID=29760 RepID=A0A438HRE1_VITVI|nr:hypothetical protein CK203_043506 [Vitis vinifera]
MASAEAKRFILVFPEGSAVPGAGVHWLWNFVALGWFLPLKGLGRCSLEGAVGGSKTVILTVETYVDKAQKVGRSWRPSADLGDLRSGFFKLGSGTLKWGAFEMGFMPKEFGYGGKSLVDVTGGLKRKLARGKG